MDSTIKKCIILALAIAIGHFCGEHALILFAIGLGIIWYIKLFSHLN